MLAFLNRYVQIDRRHNILEVGCGKGEPLERLRKDRGCFTYATEEDIALFEEARENKRVDRIARGTPGHNLFVATEAFSVIVAHREDEIEKTKQLVRWAHAHLEKGGVLALALYASELEPVLHYALFGFDLFHGFNLPQGGEVGLILTRRDKPGKPTKQQIEGLIKEVDSRRVSNGLPYGKTVYQTPVPFQRENVEPFRSLWRSAEEVEALVRRSTLAQEAITAVTRGQIALEEIPPLPLKAGHVALQLATGRFNGAVGEGENRHVVKGRVVRTPVETEEEAEDGEMVTIVRQVLSIEVTAIDRNGEVTVLRSDSEESGGEGGAESA